MIILTDVHGNFDTMQALLSIIPDEEKSKGIVICGDLIDRGPKSMQVVQWCIDNNIQAVRGNHENMMLDWNNNGRKFSDQLWLLNGGINTLDSYKESSEDEYLKGEIQWDIFQAHCEWMETLPYYIEFPNVKKEERHLVISHSNITNVWKMRDTPQGQNIMTWGRPNSVNDVPHIYNVIGHTPQEHIPRIRNCYANIDTGCFYTQKGYGKLTALQFPEMILYQHKNIDTGVSEEPLYEVFTEVKLKNKKMKKYART